MRKRRVSPRSLGERNRNARMNVEKVKELRKLDKEGMLTQVELARKYGISQSTVNSILNRKTWGHVR